MNKKIKKRLSKVKKEIKKLVIDPTPRQLIVGTTVASSIFVNGILIAGGGIPIVFPALVSAGITVGTVVGITYLVEKINELDENNRIIENNYHQCQTKKLVPTR